jgi:hypothetical protein
MNHDALNSKPWWKSRTIWLGFLELGIGLLDVLADSDFTGESTDGALLTAAGTLTLLLRYLTHQPIQPLRRPLSGSGNRATRGV